MSASHAIQAALKGLKGYLEAQTPLAALQVLAEFPDANDTLVYPTLSIFVGKPRLMNLPPYQIAVTAPDSNKQVVVTEVVGEWDCTFQLDLWTRDKLQRDTYLGLVMDAINKAVGDDTGHDNGAGLSLQLSNYFDSFIRFDIDGFTYVDDEAAAQRRERRVKIDVLVNGRAVRQRTLYAMINLQSQIAAGVKQSDVDKTETFNVS